MDNWKTLSVLFFLILALTGCNQTVTTKIVEPTTNDFSHLSDGTTPDDAIELFKITDQVWMHVSHLATADTLIAANGLVLVGETGLVLINTPWNDTQTTRLLAFCHETFQLPFTHAIVTAAHDDGMGGMQSLLDAGIPVHALPIVIQQAEKLGYILPDQAETMPETQLSLEGFSMTLYYPGPAHTYDNTVIWLDSENLLFAGSMVKELGTPSLGIRKTAALRDWENSLNNLHKRFSSVEYVVPSQGSWGTVELIEHTKTLTNP